MFKSVFIVSVMVAGRGRSNTMVSPSPVPRVQSPPVVSFAAFTLATASRSVHSPSLAVVLSAVLLTVIGTGFEAGPAVLTPSTRDAGSWASAVRGKKRKHTAATAAVAVRLINIFVLQPGRCGKWVASLLSSGDLVSIGAASLHKSGLLV